MPPPTRLTQPAARVALLVLAGVLAVAAPARALLAPSVNPIPLAALQMLCAEPAASACNLGNMQYTGPCAGLAEHPVLAAAAWRSVGAPDACLLSGLGGLSGLGVLGGLSGLSGLGGLSGLSGPNATLRAVPPNRLLLDNNFTALRRFDTLAGASSSANASAAIALRVRFVYLQGLAGGAVHLRSAGYALAMAPLQDAPHAVHVRSECGARGFSAPDNHLPPALGGAVLEVQLATVAGAPERLCTWQCELPFLKMPWNDPALSEQRPTSRGRCLATPPSFTAVALSFAVRFPANQSLRYDSARMLLGVDRMAEDMAAALAPRFGALSVLLSLRNSTVNMREVGGVLDWARAFNARQGFVLEARDNPDFGLSRDVDLAAPARRRLLEARAGDNILVVDGVVVAPRSDAATCCLADDAVAAQQSLPPGAYDLGAADAAVEPAQVQTVLLITQTPVQHEFVMPPPEAEADGGPFTPVFVLFIVLLVLCLFGAWQAEGFYRSQGESDTSNSQTQRLLQ